MSVFLGSTRLRMGENELVAHRNVSSVTVHSHTPTHMYKSAKLLDRTECVVDVDCSIGQNVFLSHFFVYAVCTRTHENTFRTNTSHTGL